jgi:hypothetical protein
MTYFLQGEEPGSPRKSKKKLLNLEETPSKKKIVHSLFHAKEGVSLMKFQELKGCTLAKLQVKKPYIRKSKLKKS